MLVYSESKDAVKRARGLLIVDTVPSTFLAFIIATGEDENANVDIRCLHHDGGKGSIVNTRVFFKLEFGNDMDWKKKKTCIFGVFWGEVSSQPKV